MSPAELLRKAANRIRQPGAWTQGEYAKAADGTSVRSVHPAAVCWCAYGAMRKESVGHYIIRQRAVHALENEIEPGAASSSDVILDFNDTPGRTAEEVASAMERAAASLDGAS